MSDEITCNNCNAPREFLLIVGLVFPEGTVESIKCFKCGYLESTLLKKENSNAEHEHIWIEEEGEL